jgi:hypothetical protein
VPYKPSSRASDLVKPLSAYDAAADSVDTHSGMRTSASAIRDNFRRYLHYCGANITGAIDEIYSVGSTVCMHSLCDIMGDCNMPRQRDNVHKPAVKKSSRRQRQDLCASQVDMGK